MAPRLIEEGKIQILGQTFNSVVYAVANDSKTGYAKDSSSVLKGGTVWYEGREALGPCKGAEESDENARKEASIYKALGQHDRILRYLGLEVSNLGEEAGPKAWAIRLERAPCGSLRNYIMSSEANPPSVRNRLQLTVQFAEGVVHMHRCGVIWGDLSTRNALLFDGWRIKLCDFTDSDLLDTYSDNWYGCEVRYCPPGSNRPHHHTIGTVKRELFALGTAIYEIIEWRVPYGPQTEVSEDEVITALVNGDFPQLSGGNPAGSIIRRSWEYRYELSQQLLDDLHGLDKITRES